ncbi:hypothetical protein GCM10010339_92540 [Streptomyces alanosinicus]|uniref:Uncharacterized protein n=1 Tax=Streptomyces alanosinicus TaxID=68171 RepID=A0A919D8A8_9ACTN|nr:hypothetical protein GCM10010339_92540 [Streptomyces alanosinicus]
MLMFELVTSACGPRVALIPGINRCADVPPPHEPFVAPAHPTGLGLRRSSKARAYQEVTAEWARTTNTNEWPW